MELIKLKTKENQEIQLGKINILVGANNVGKSQTLIDIKDRMITGTASKPVLIDEFIFKKPANFDELFSGLKLESHKTSIEHHNAVGINNQLLGAESIAIHKQSLENQFDATDNLDFLLGNLSKLRLSFLDASSRLSLAQTVKSFNPHTETPQNILHSLLKDQITENELNKAFKKAFSMSVRMDDSGYTEFCIRVAKNFRKIPDNTREAFPIMSKYNKLDNQGDGFKSFVGIVLSILFSNDRIILIDEPEAFLHPAQAKFLGKWIADQANRISGQLIISTHNSNFLAGILTSTRNVNIYRVNRVDDNTTFHLLPPSATSRLAKSPLLSSQRVLESIFHKGVIVCEADADRTVYQTVASKLYNNQNIYFLHSHNKQTLKNVVELLQDARIPVGAIADIDILNDSVIFKNIVEVLSGKPISNNLINTRNEIAEIVENQTEEEILNTLTESVGELLTQLNNNEHNLDGAKGALNRIKKAATKWSNQKDVGLESFVGDNKTKVKRFIGALKRYRLFVVPVGELEGWMHLGTKRKNKWIVKALEEINQDQSSEELKNFIKDILIKMGENIS